MVEKQNIKIFGQSEIKLIIFLFSNKIVLFSLLVIFFIGRYFNNFHIFSINFSLLEEMGVQAASG